ncbi:hypothetical protein HPP92_023982 [Vanilla planifolia]|uniref:Mediator of RNA polymerase II transcription subunit 25 n=1 Tax=Vanilla planifolia TaxID=51239 RepID=A0A835PR47_VANPL|nr:hypothetical protein HPP92_023982 [Vanilla planifolia]
MQHEETQLRPATGGRRAVLAMLKTTQVWRDILATELALIAVYREYGMEDWLLLGQFCVVSSLDSLNPFAKWPTIMNVLLDLSTEVVRLLDFGGRWDVVLVGSFNSDLLSASLGSHGFLLKRVVLVALYPAEICYFPVETCNICIAVSGLWRRDCVGDLWLNGNSVVTIKEAVKVDRVDGTFLEFFSSLFRTFRASLKFRNINRQLILDLTWCFCGNELSGQKLSGATPELALVVFNTHGPYSAFLVQRTGWTKDIEVFLWWLSRIPFSGGGFGDAAIAEGLSEALAMFPVPANASQSLQNLDVQKHCILVAASNPYPLATPVVSLSIPNIDQSENAKQKSETCLADAEAVAKSFSQCSVSLSVICPRQLPKLKALYIAVSCKLIPHLCLFGSVLHLNSFYLHCLCPCLYCTLFVCAGFYICLKLLVSITNLTYMFSSLRL